MVTYYVSSKRMTIMVDVDSNGKIIKAAPIARKFIGQPFKNLERWMVKQGGFHKKVIGQ